MSVHVSIDGGSRPVKTVAEFISRAKIVPVMFENPQPQKGLEYEINLFATAIKYKVNLDIGDKDDWHSFLISMEIPLKPQTLKMNLSRGLWKLRSLPQEVRDEIEGLANNFITENRL